MSKDLPYMRFWISDYRNDPAVRLMTIEERGAYLEIIFELWEQGGFIDADLDSLAKLINMKPRRFKKVFDSISEKFLIINDKITHKKVTAEIQVIRKKSDKARDSANHRWERNANAMRTHSDGNANQSQSQSHIKKPIVNSKDDTEENHKTFFRPLKTNNPKLAHDVGNILKPYKDLLSSQSSVDTPKAKRLVKTLTAHRQLNLSYEKVLGFIIQARNAEGIDNRMGYCIKILTSPDFAVGDNYLQTAKEMIRKWTDQAVDSRVKDILPDLGADA